MVMTWVSPKPASQGQLLRHSKVFHLPELFKGLFDFLLMQQQYVGNKKNLIMLLISLESLVPLTHIQIIAPHIDENEFVNRHHYHSINVQVVFDANSRLLDVNAKWPGSTHDARIFNESGLKMIFEGNHIPVHTHLLGDSGYPSRRYRLTPFLRPQPGAHTNYNR